MKYGVSQLGYERTEKKPFSLLEKIMFPIETLAFPPLSDLFHYVSSWAIFLIKNAYKTVAW